MNHVEDIALADAKTLVGLKIKASAIIACHELHGQFDQMRVSAFWAAPKIMDEIMALKG